MNNEPKISVIVPVHNGEVYVRGCLKNLMDQSYKNLEIIVVDDGSSDHSAEIAGEFPVEVIRHPQNRGPSASRNTGMDRAKGDYIHFMDVDDGINRDFYLEMATSVKETDADIACCSVINRVKPHECQFFRKKRTLTGVRERLIVTNVWRWGYVWRYLLRADFLRERNLRFEEGRLIEDLPFSLAAVFFANKVALSPGAIYTYEYQENSLMNNKDNAYWEKRNQDWLHAKAFRREFAQKHGFKIPGVNTDRIAYWYRFYIASRIVNFLFFRKLMK